MLRRHAQLRALLLTAGDVLSTAGALTSAYLLRFVTGFFTEPGPWYPMRYLEALPAAVLLAILTFWATGTYRPPQGPDSRGSDLRTTTGGVLAASLVLAAVALFYRDVYEFSRGVLLLFPFVAVPLVYLARRMARRLLGTLHRRGLGVSRAILLGEGSAPRALRKAIEERPWAGIRIVLEVSDPEALPGAVREQSADQVFLALPPERHEALVRAAVLLSSEMVDVRVVPDLSAFGTLNPDAAVLGGVPILTLQETPFYGVRRVLKRLFDILAGALLLVLSAPALLLASLAVLIGSGRPVLYRQERMGLDGRRFLILKLRTMRADAEEDTGAVWARRGDPRCTRVGAWLRRLSLDELPQLLNVLKGEMSLVGPRPERPVLIGRFREKLPGYMLRHRIPAGLTGWAQVHGLRGDTDLSERLRYDLAYLEHWSLFLDVEILVRTVWQVLAGRNAV